ncbi:MAG TPA: NADH-quinone oxidoreductase subunit N [Bacteroidales bacterium]|nr:NADH-quinone oxidoreductase subunit N [Bacteroidales bacterium]
MNLNSFLLMRHELVLIAVALILLIAEIFISDQNKGRIRGLAIILFAINAIIGFFPAETGTLFGGMFTTTPLSIVVKNILNIGTLIVIIQSNTWLKTDENSDKFPEFYVILISTLIGMFYMVSAGDFLMFYLGLELATIPLAALVAYDRFRNSSAEGGIKLILSSAFSSGIMLYGISMIYGMYGSIYFDLLNASIAMNSLTVLAFIFFFAGMAFKISLVPFHLWAADVYEGAPVSVTSYLSVISKGAAVFVLTAILFKVFPTVSDLWQKVVWVIAVMTMTIGNLFAIRQQNLKRFIAFSSISQAGFFLLGVIGGNAMGMTAIVYYMLVYIFSNLAVFGVIGAISSQSGKENMDDYNGLYHTNPMLSLTMMLALFSLAGIPPVAGFFGKFFLFTAAAQKGYYILVLIATINTIVSLYYYLLVVKAMFINKSETPIPYFKSDFHTKLGLGICIAGLIITGFASGVWEMISKIAFGM